MSNQDSRARVRDIYEASLVSNEGFSDTPYQVLVDLQSGVAFEGRSAFGIEEQIRHAGDGYTGTNDKGQFPEGAHARGDNETTFGIAIIGNLVTQPVTPQALKTIVELCAWQCLVNGIDPKGTSPAVVGVKNGVPGEPVAQTDPKRIEELKGEGEVLLRDVPNIRGHNATFNSQCPGQLTRYLPWITDRVVQEMYRLAPEARKEFEGPQLGHSLEPTPPR